MSLHALDRFGGEALYSQIARLLEIEVQQFYRPGDCLPAEATLAEQFGVNRHTLRRAVDQLVQAGILIRHHGKGVFVLNPPLNYTVKATTRFTETVEAQGFETSTRVLRRLVSPAQKGVAGRLAITEGEEVLWLETLRLANDLPICLVSHFFPASWIGNALDSYTGGSLHATIEQALNVRLRRLESLVSATHPLGDDALHLAMPQNGLVLRVKSINVIDNNEQPVEYTLTRFRADRVHLRINP